MNKAKADVLVMERDRMHCAACGRGVSGERGWDYHLHHRRPRSLGGSSLAWVNMPANLVLLHAHCHSEIESERSTWRERGFLVSANGVLRAGEVPIQHAALGYVRLLDDGGWVPA